MTARARRSVCLALALVAIALAGAGCSQAASPAAAALDRANPWTLPGVLRIGSDARPDNLNPLLSNDQIVSDLSMFWSGYLFNWSNANEFVPELATIVPTQQNGGISRDGLTITYHLRRGVQWQDGVPFTADDVVFTWHAVMNPRNEVAGRTGYELISGIQEPDDHTVVVHLRRPYAPFVSTFLTMSNTAYCILPKHLLAQYPDLNHVPFNRLPVGTGPFRVVFDDGTHVKMVANPRYWRGAPGLREVDFRSEADQTTLVSDLAAHVIDFAYDADTSFEPQLHDIAGTTIYLYPFNSYGDVGFNTASPLVSDRRVRQALAYAIDRTNIVQRLSNGIDLPADSDQPVFSWAHADGLKQYSYDPRMARKLLDAAGWKLGRGGVRVKDGRRLRLLLVSDADGTAPSPEELSIEHGWRSVGADVDIRHYPDTRLWALYSAGGIEASGKFDAVLDRWVNGVDPDDSLMFMCRMAPPAGENDYHYCNPALDAAEQEATTSNDLVARKAAYDRIQRILAEDVPVTVLYFDQYQDVVNVDLKNYRPASAVTPFWNTWQYTI